MRVYERKSQFGWENDDGLGEQLIQQILRGEKTATAGPKVLHSVAELQELYDSVGQYVTVVDKHDVPRCNIKILQVFETRFGSPDPRLVEGEGYGADADAFCEAHRQAWADLVAQGRLRLEDATVLIVELFELELRL